MELIQKLTIDLRDEMQRLDIEYVKSVNQLVAYYNDANHSNLDELNNVGMHAQKTFNDLCHPFSLIKENYDTVLLRISQHEELLNLMQDMGADKISNETNN